MFQFILELLGIDFKFTFKGIKNLAEMQYKMFTTKSNMNKF